MCFTETVGPFEMSQASVESITGKLLFSSKAQLIWNLKCHQYFTNFYLHITETKIFLLVHKHNHG